MMMRVLLALALAVAAFACSVPPAAAAPDTANLRAVVIVSRHGVRSPTNPTELNAYVAHQWPAWEVAPGFLTPHGAALMTSFGAAYRSYYSAAGLLPAHGCPQAGTVWFYADIDQRTKATASALLDGLAPHCGLAPLDAGNVMDDPLFHAVPTIAKADPNLSATSVAGSLGGEPAAVVAANALAFAKLDTLLGCDGTNCKHVTAEAPAVVTSPKSGLTSIGGSVDLASTAVEDPLLAYTDGKTMSDFGAPNLDAAALLQLSALHTLKSALTTETWYAARAQGSNLMAHLAATIDQAASERRDEKTKAPAGARFIAFVGHDTNLSALSGLLHLRWLMPGYQLDDTPPGGALVFEVYAPPGTAEPFVRTFFTAQSLDEMRNLSTAMPARVPLYVPGCPGYDCPISVFDRIVQSVVDPAFVGPW